jgi:thiosulfate/3-mercaptopyruvate sulfurtransferase
MQSFRTLIDAATLNALLGRRDLRIVDCRHDLADPAAGRRAYAEAHLPGAVFMHLDEDLSGVRTGSNGRHPLPNPVTFAARLGALGIAPEDQVVAYDDAGGAIAARLWWMLRWIGHERAAVLDGGLRAWRAAGLPLESAVPAPVPSCIR